MPEDPFRRSIGGPESFSNKAIAALGITPNKVVSLGDSISDGRSD